MEFQPLTLVSSDMQRTEQALVEFARQMAGATAFDPTPGGDVQTDQVPVAAAASYLIEQAWRYFESVLKTAPYADWQDCTQETIARIWRRLADPNSIAIENPRGYFSSVRQSVLAEHWKRSAKTPKTAAIDLSSVPEAEAESEIDFEIGDFIIYLNCYAEGLVETFRAALQAEGCTRKSAELLGVSVDTVRTRLDAIKRHWDRFLASRD